ncbi:type II secretion system F family protein [Micromonospora aurantiaca (nom. illeg.)]|uniref:type II secretion system F family protein n=1 Tax=Micromonospora aurantiaca (nom. illeg.) TaxID=47850 RepID=UPI0033FF7CC3
MNAGVAMAMAFGALAGLGVYLVIRGMLPTVPALGPALQRMHPPQITVSTPAPGPDSQIGQWVAARFGARLRPPHQELQLIGQSVERYAAEKASYAALGLLFPPLLSLMLLMFGLAIPIAIPAAASLGLAILLFLLVDVSIRQKAAAAREEFVRAVAAYLDLVALERAASHGPVESLERAARVSDSWVFLRIQAALDAARFASLPPWDGLSQVADEIGVPELGDVGDIMRLSGTEGAQVYQTLVSRARSLRVALRTKEQDRANTATTWLYVPTSLTVLVLFILAGYPFLVRLVTT